MIPVYSHASRPVSAQSTTSPRARRSLFPATAKASRGGSTCAETAPGCPVGSTTASKNRGHSRHSAPPPPASTRSRHGAPSPPAPMTRGPIVPTAHAIRSRVRGLEVRLVICPFPSSVFSSPPEEICPSLTKHRPRG